MKVTPIDKNLYANFYKQVCENECGNYVAYANAITDVWIDDDNNLWAGNGEYYSQINFCPFCGKQHHLDEMRNNYVSKSTENAATS